MYTVKVYNKLGNSARAFFGCARSLILFGSIKRARIGKGVRLSSNMKLGKNIYIQDFTKIQGGRVSISDDVFIHENVFIRGKVSLGRGCTINRNSCILDNVAIGEYCSIAPNCVIVGSDHNFNKKNELIKRQGSKSEGILIEDDVWIGSNVSVLDGVTIGKGAVVAAGAVVKSSLPAYSVSAGVPARIIKYRY